MKIKIVLKIFNQFILYIGSVQCSIQFFISSPCLAFICFYCFHVMHFPRKLLGTSHHSKDGPQNKLNYVKYQSLVMSLTRTEPRWRLERTQLKNMSFICNNIDILRIKINFLQKKSMLLDIKIIYAKTLAIKTFSTNLKRKMNNMKPNHPYLLFKVTKGFIKNPEKELEEYYEVVAFTG